MLPDSQTDRPTHRQTRYIRWTNALWRRRCLLSLCVAHKEWSSYTPWLSHSTYHRTAFPSCWSTKVAATALAISGIPVCVLGLADADDRAPLVGGTGEDGRPESKPICFLASSCSRPSNCFLTASKAYPSLSSSSVAFCKAGCDTSDYAKQHGYLITCTYTQNAWIHTCAYKVYVHELYIITESKVVPNVRRLHLASSMYPVIWSINQPQQCHGILNNSNVPFETLCAHEYKQPSRTVQTDKHLVVHGSTNDTWLYMNKP